MQKAYKLQGKHRHYDWGGTQFIPALMGVENKSNAPYAEYWMGAHPAAVAEITTEQGVVLLDKMLADEGKMLLGEKTLANFGTLPYLYKVLDVANMLSIQAHPNKQNAIIGYEKEEAAGIDLKNAVKELKAITKRIDLIHANGSRDEFDSSRDRHSNFAESILPQDEIAQVVKDAGCNVIIETAEPGVKDDIKFLLKQVS